MVVRMSHHRNLVTQRRSTMATKKGSAKTKNPKAPAVSAAPAKKSRAEMKPSGKVSALTAAARVLQEAGVAMSCPELIQVMADKGYWKSPGGKTPQATLYSSLTREIKTQGNKSRFKKTGPGKFARS